MKFQKKISSSMWLRLLALAALPLVTSCGVIPDLQQEKTDDPDEKFDFVKRNNNERYKEPDEKKADNVEIDVKGKSNDKLKKQADELSKAPHEKQYDKTPAEKRADADHKGQHLVM